MYSTMSSKRKLFNNTESKTIPTYIHKIESGSGKVFKFNSNGFRLTTVKKECIFNHSRCMLNNEVKKNECIPTTRLRIQHLPAQKTVQDIPSRTAECTPISEIRRPNLPAQKTVQGIPPETTDIYVIVFPENL